MVNSDFKQGDVVVVPFPYTDQLAEKRRPALVISNSSFHQRNGLVWVAMITSAENDPWADDILLPSAGSGLSAPSVIRISKIATIDQSRVLRKVGDIDVETLQVVNTAVKRNLG